VGTMAATWSLAVEEQFYLTAPFAIRILSRRTLAYLLLGIIGSAPILRIGLHLMVAHGNFADYVLTPCRADALSIGMLSALGLRVQRVKEWIESNTKLLHCIIFALGACLAGLTMVGSAGTSTIAVSIGYSLLATFYATVLVVGVTS